MKILNNRDRSKLRDKIMGAKLIESLQAFALSKEIKLSSGKRGVPKLTPTRLRANLALLNKILPDLKSQEIIADVTQTKKVISSLPMTEEEWDEKYSKDNNVVKIK